MGSRRTHRTGRRGAAHYRHQDPAHSRSHFLHHAQPTRFSHTPLSSAEKGARSLSHTLPLSLALSLSPSLALAFSLSRSLSRSLALALALALSTITLSLSSALALALALVLYPTTDAGRTCRVLSIDYPGRLPRPPMQRISLSTGLGASGRAATRHPVYTQRLIVLHTPRPTSPALLRSPLYCKCIRL